MALNTVSASFIKQIPMPDSLSFAHDKVYIRKRIDMQYIHPVLHYISLFAPYKMPDRNFFVTASKRFRFVALIKHA